MGKDVNNAYIYRIGHPLAQYVIAQAKGNDTPSNVSLTFDYTNYPEKMSAIEEAVGKEGLLSVNLERKTKIESLLLLLTLKATKWNLISLTNS